MLGHQCALAHLHSTGFSAVSSTSSRCLWQTAAPKMFWVQAERMVSHAATCMADEQQGVCGPQLLPAAPDRCMGGGASAWQGSSDALGRGLPGCGGALRGTLAPGTPVPCSSTRPAGADRICGCPAEPSAWSACQAGQPSSSSSSSSSKSQCPQSPFMTPHHSMQYSIVCHGWWSNVTAASFLGSQWKIACC